MTEQSLQDMKSACHTTAEWTLRRPCRSNRCKWLQKKIAALLSDPVAIQEYADLYEQEYPYADVQSPFLADILKSYDEEVAQ